jgi:hypothetical protein
MSLRYSIFEKNIYYRLSLYTLTLEWLSLLILIYNEINLEIVVPLSRYSSIDYAYKYSNFTIFIFAKYNIVGLVWYIPSNLVSNSYYTLPFTMSCFSMSFKPVDFVSWITLVFSCWLVYWRSLLSLKRWQYTPPRNAIIIRFKPGLHWGVF